MNDEDFEDVHYNRLIEEVSFTDYIRLIKDLMYIVRYDIDSIKYQVLTMEYSSVFRGDSNREDSILFLSIVIEYYPLLGNYNDKSKVYVIEVIKEVYIELVNGEF